MQPENMELNREGGFYASKIKLTEEETNSADQMFQSFSFSKLYLFRIVKKFVNSDFETPLNILILRQFDFAKPKCQIPRPIELYLFSYNFLKMQIFY